MQITFTVARARRLAVSLVLCTLIQLTAPTPALAWFGWLDEWSGPGPFWGQSYDVRLACFGNRLNLRNLDRDGAAAFEALTRLELNAARLPAAELGPAVLAARAQWVALIAALEEVQRQFPVLPTKLVKDGELTSLRALLNEAPFAPLGDKAVYDGPTVAKDAKTFATEARKVLKDHLNPMFHAAIAQGAVGTLWSFCPADVERRVSIELNVNLWKTKEDNPRFAAGERVRLTTVMPSVTWRFIDDERYDVVEAGVAAGVYTFSSSEFQSFSGFMFEPIRLDFHAPTDWNNGNRIQQTLALFTFRWGYMMAPAGFDPNVFAGPGDTTQRFPAEIVATTAVFFNLKPLLYKR